MGLFDKAHDKYRTVAKETAHLENNDISVSEYYIVERKYTSIFGKEKWKPIKQREYHGYSIRTFKNEKEAGGWIKYQLHRIGDDRVIKIYESREDKIDGILDDV